MKKLLTLFLAIVMLCLSSSMFACKNKVKLELATTTADLKGFENYVTDEDAIRGLHQAGFRNIDLSLSNLSYLDPLMQDNWKEEADKLKAVAEELGMKFVQSHAPVFQNAFKTPIETVEEYTIRAIEICGYLGIKNLVVHAGWGDGWSKEQWFEANKAFYERLLPTAEQNNVYILCENLTYANIGQFYYAHTGADLREFVKYVNHPNLHAAWDMGHANCDGEQYEHILALADEMYAIHYHDNKGTDSHQIPGFGSMDNNKVLEALKQINYTGYFTFEANAGNRTFGTYNGPDKIKIIKEKKGVKFSEYTRLETEILLYQVGERLLAENGMLAK